MNKAKRKKKQQTQHQQVYENFIASFMKYSQVLPIAATEYSD